MRSKIWLFLLCWLPLFADGVESRPVVLAHYMPWYATRDVSGRWGWHWTMNHYDPERASHDAPMIGLYDSGDPAALECQVLQMKLVGLDGVVIDWYGTKDYQDYAVNHRNTERLIGYLKKAGLRFAICYEDQAIGQMVRGKVLPETEALEQAKRDLQWVEEHWFSDEAYVREEGRPVLLVFGPQYLQAAQWKELRTSLKSQPLIHGLPHLVKEHGLDGAFAWPPVSDGKKVSPEQWAKELDGYATNHKRLIATVFPGFHDIYAQAGLHESYGRIEARSGKTFAETLDRAMQSGSKLIQIATWNDYGEGTGIEPTLNQGYRYLDRLHGVLRPGQAAADLRLPAELYRLRKRGGDAGELDAAAGKLFAGDVAGGASLIAKVKAAVEDGGAAFAEMPGVVDADYHLETDKPYWKGEAAKDPGKLRCRLDVYYPVKQGKFPTLVWFHGGGLTAGNRSIPVPLRHQGVAVVAVNYRLGPEDGFPASLEDAGAAVAWTLENIAKFGGDPDRVFVAGHSAGAYLTCMVGLDDRWLAPHGKKREHIAGLIPLSAQVITHFANREERGIGEKQPIIDDLAPLYHVKKDAPPILLVTGDREKELMGRYEENAYFWRMLKLNGHPDVTLRELEGFDHGSMPEPAFPLVLDMMRKVKRPK
jgi:acetyl esterase/lipase